MAVGDWHDLNGYRFRETLFGPMAQRVCIDCGRTAYATFEYTRPRCGKCLAKYHHRNEGEEVDAQD